MFNALNFVDNKEWNTFSFSLNFFYIYMVQDYPNQINVINELGQQQKKVKVIKQ